jgi:hypothetical protein
MRTLKTALGLLLCIVVAGPAHAGGSLPLNEVMDHLKDNEKLIAEINAELKAQKLEATSVICCGPRFGGHWEELGGARAVPYECEIGGRKLNIDGTIHIYDEKGAEIDMDDENAPKRAFDYKETDVSWKWE